MQNNFILPDRAKAEGWISLNDQQATLAEKELEREICSEHVLKNLQLRAVARLQGSDDFLFQIQNFDQTYAEVHLTYNVESDPRWPAAELFPDLESWLDELYDD